jgi:hypothetical protein
MHLEPKLRPISGSINVLRLPLNIPNLFRSLDLTYYFSFHRKIRYSSKILIDLPYILDVRT